MDYDEFSKNEILLLSLAARGRNGDADAVSELYKFAQAALEREFTQHQSTGRKINKKKKYEIMLWAVSAAKKQFDGGGSINLKKLTADTLLLAELENVRFTEHTAREVINQNISTIINYAKPSIN